MPTPNIKAPNRSTRSEPGRGETMASKSLSRCQTWATATQTEKSELIIPEKANVAVATVRNRQMQYSGVGRNYFLTTAEGAETSEAPRPFGCGISRRQAVTAAAVHNRATTRKVPLLPIV